MSTTLPPTDALSLVCAALKPLDHLDVVVGGDQTLDLTWFGFGERVVDSAVGPITVPASWNVHGHVEAFAIGSVK